MTKIISRYRFLIIGGIAIVVFLTIAVFVALSEPQNQWTIQTLKEHYDYVLKERDEKINQKFESLELAVLKAEQATEKRFESVNEFRSQLADQGRTFIARTEYEAGHKELTNRVDELKMEIEKINNLKSGGNIIWAYVITGVSLIVGIFSIRDKVFKNNNLKNN
jgi:hypothetical protein